MTIPIMSLMGILFAAQIFLAIKQIKKGAPDGKVLLIIDLTTLILWTPLSICRLLFTNTLISVLWYLIALAYMIFTIWYTKTLNRSMGR